jgi:hypothetical protein
MSQGQFNALRACFWLVAFVIAAHVVAVLLAEAACLWYIAGIVAGTFKCDAEGRMTELLAAALAATIAFASGFSGRGPSPPPQLPTEVTPEPKTKDEGEV